jgi:hypothetical protein
MPKRGPGGNPGGDAADFEQTADRLYGVPPSEFTATRDELARRAREQGDAALAKRLTALRKPTQSAWLVNLLWRERNDVVEQLLGVGAELREAQEHLAGDELRELFAQRQRIVAALVQQARRLAVDAGVRVTADTAREVEETLGAALADPAVAAEVRSGRLVKPTSYAGFGPGTAAVRLLAPPREDAAPKPGAGAVAPPAERRDDAALRERLAEAEKSVSAAAEAVRDAEDQLAARQDALDEATTARDELRAHLDELREQVRDTERRLAETELDVRSGSTAVRKARQAITGAQRRLERAERARDEVARHLPR